MINITNANTAGRLYRFGCFHVGVMTLAADVSDVLQT